MSPTPTRVPRTPRRAAVVATLAAAGVLAASGVASAHVTVHPETYAKGAVDGTLTFRVPNEEGAASTTQVQIVFPADHPIPGVMVTAEPGWTAKVTTAHLKTPIKTDDGTITDAVSEITWTGGKIQPGQYQDFNASFGQLPDDTDQLVFKALQTYSDGKVARWIEEPKAGGEEPENPAPVLRLTQAAAPATATPRPTTSAAATSTASGSDSTARALGIAGLVVGVLGLGAAGFSLSRGRRSRQ
ncbi:YcnI family protein [Streptomyces sp. RKAG293]|uniref:YcnI family copper-binding membrane protein n=1 Tax=Streptomyces sp. RKAG293 TaxID=2893403 RepID=UPI002033FA17|nr:YcnI family protein [Streptomyces sp. RKAG293]MCM2416911.1 YcnI family protein [Streptomyces sp. RKAG293]